MTNDIEQEAKAAAEDKDKAIPEEKSKASNEDTLRKAGGLQDDELELTTGGVRTYGPIMN